MAKADWRHTKTIEDEQSEMSTAKRLYRLARHRSPYIKEYIEDPNDDWFVYVVTIKKKTFEWTYSSMITKNDLCQWVGFDERNGWVIETLN